MSQNFMEALFQGPKDVVMAQKIVKVAVYVSLFIAIFTASFAIAGLYQTSSDTTWQYIMDPWSLFDVFLMLIFTYFLYKRKLWASICIVVHQVLNLVIIYLDLGRFPGAIAMFKLILFISAIRAIRLINQDVKNHNVENA
ncbi:hypothetical protein [uncultured Ferrimonas sp.]|uniref:hypothetical protein n=1 Tax=uncultured Ferrimonas sp. TaxID=432640 RepID=UPI00260771E8|nr:hypothetical protein [uncultured Ferrimonas sp.]